MRGHGNQFQCAVTQTEDWVALGAKEWIERESKKERGKEKDEKVSKIMTEKRRIEGRRERKIKMNKVESRKQKENK